MIWLPPEGRFTIESCVLERGVFIHGFVGLFPVYKLLHGRNRASIKYDLSSVSWRTLINCCRNIMCSIHLRIDVPRCQLETEAASAFAPKSTSHP